ncbi:DUF1272 domain-containing protein [Kitasatospora sp. GP82]|nr:DUF1272 domain-containing protein [Kitasatospora sp. GP82]
MSRGRPGTGTREICARCEVSPSLRAVAFLCSYECTFCPECTS